MSTLIATDNDFSQQPLPWYRYAWPWFLIGIPMVSVCLGMVMLYLAFNVNNSLVVDDYYKEGKAYNLRIERDRLASVLGLEAVITQSSEGLIMELDQTMPAQLPEGLEVAAQSAAAAFNMPETVTLRWVHVTEEQRDGTAQMMFIGGNRYIAQAVSLPQEGKFRLHLEPTVKAVPASSPSAAPTGQSMDDHVGWRLISSLHGFTEKQPVRIPAPALDKVFTRDRLQ